MNKIKNLIQKKIGLSFWCDWLQIFPIKRWNWIDICFIHFGIEWDKVDNTLCIEIVLLGFGMRFSINLDFIGKTEQKKELDRRIKEVMRNES